MPVNALFSNIPNVALCGTTSPSTCSQKWESTTSVQVENRMFTWHYKPTNISFFTIFSQPFQICCLTTILLIKCELFSAIKLLVLALELIEQTGDKSLFSSKIQAFFPKWSHYQTPLSLSFWTMISLFAFCAVWKAALLLSFSGVALWTSFYVSSYIP